MALVVPEHAQLLVPAAGLTYDGPEPDAFLPRDAVIDLFRDYAPRIAAPVQHESHPDREGGQPLQRGDHHGRDVH